MTKLPFMPMWWPDYLVDTRHLSAEEHGAYLLLLGAMWMRGGSIPDDDVDLTRIACVAPGRWSRVKARITPFMTLTEDGEWTQRRLAEELNRVSGIRKANSQNAKSGWERRKNKNNDLASATASEPHEPESSHLYPYPSKKDANASSVTSAKPKVPIEEAFQAYNLKAKALGLSLAQKLTASRKTKLGARLRECGGLEGWQKALDELDHASMLIGAGSSGWRADLDFMLRPDKLTRIIEGGYRDRERKAAPPQAGVRRNGVGYYLSPGCEQFNAHRDRAKQMSDPKYWAFIEAEKNGTEVHVTELWPQRR